MTINIQLGTDDRTNAASFCFQAESNDAADVGVVGYTNAMVAKVGGFSRECFGGDGAIAEREGSVGAELDRHVFYR
jgi:hypothetical protein